MKMMALRRLSSMGLLAGCCFGYTVSCQPGYEYGDYRSLSGYVGQWAYTDTYYSDSYYEDSYYYEDTYYYDDGYYDGGYYYDDYYYDDNYYDSYDDGWGDDYWDWP